MNDTSGDALVEMAEAIRGRADFVSFLPVLLRNLRDHPEEWTNDSLERFLEGMLGFVEGMDGYYANIGVAVDTETPGWRVVADSLLAARVYE